MWANNVNRDKRQTHQLPIIDKLNRWDCLTRYFLLSWRICRCERRALVLVLRECLKRKGGYEAASCPK